MIFCCGSVVRIMNHHRAPRTAHRTQTTNYVCKISIWYVAGIRSAIYTFTSHLNLPFFSRFWISINWSILVEYCFDTILSNRMVMLMLELFKLATGQLSLLFFCYGLMNAFSRIVHYLKPLNVYVHVSPPHTLQFVHSLFKICR